MPLKEIKKSVKATSDLREPTEEEQEVFCLKLSKLKHNASILSTHLKFNKPFIPMSQTKPLPKTTISFTHPDEMNMDYYKLTV